MKTRRTVKKVLAMVFAAAMFFTSLGSPLPGASNVEAASGDDATMHFIVQYWHAVDINGNQLENVGSECEIVEGWITPSGSGYEIEIFLEGKRWSNLDGNEPTGVLKSYDDTSSGGTVTLCVDPRTQSDGTKYETFSGFSVSAGHEAVKLDDQKGDLSTIEIQYNPNVHLVKCHVFYRNDNIFVSGEPSDAVTGGLFADEESSDRNEEHDTEIVYAYPDGTAKIIPGESTTDISGTAIKSSDGKYYLTSDKNGEATAQERVAEQIDSGDITVTVGETVYDTSNTGGVFGTKYRLIP